MTEKSKQDASKTSGEGDLERLFREAEAAVTRHGTEAAATGAGGGEAGEIPVEVEPAAAASAVDPAGPETIAAERLAWAAEKKELQDKFLRQVADFENFRKRSRREQDDARSKSKEEALRDILPVVDNLERAREAARAETATAESISQGVDMVLRQFASVMERMGAVPFVSVGEPFDPALHEAIAQVETTERAPGTVFAELQRGYRLGERLLRPALVSVAKAPSTSAPEGGGAQEAGETA